MNAAPENPPAIVSPADPCQDRHGICAVYLRITGPRGSQMYAARCMRTPEGKVWRLRKADGTTYDVHRGQHGILECTCWDWIYRWANKDGDGCKHCRSLKAAGMID